MIEPSAVRQKFWKGERWRVSHPAKAETVHDTHGRLTEQEMQFSTAEVLTNTQNMFQECLN